MIESFSKIFALGHRSIDTIYDGEIEITEKVDGSQFAFGVVDDKLYMRSKGAMLYTGDYYNRLLQPNDLFFPACTHVEKLFKEGKLNNNTVYYAETLCKPTHNTLTYNEVPKNNIALFGCIEDINGSAITQGYISLVDYADKLNVDVVPLLYQGTYEGLISWCKSEGVAQEDWTDILLQGESYLGGPKIEGIVVKNYKEYFVGGQLLSIMCGKYVSESFKEVHKGKWKRERTGKGRLEEFMTSFKTEARWEKAIQYLNEQGKLDNSPKDIGPIIKRINEDILEEEEDYIKSWLYANFRKDILRESTKGFPEYYKKSLIT